MFRNADCFERAGFVTPAQRSVVLGHADPKVFDKDYVSRTFGFSTQEIVVLGRSCENSSIIKQLQSNFYKRNGNCQQMPTTEEISKALEKDPQYQTLLAERKKLCLSSEKLDKDILAKHRTSIRKSLKNHRRKIISRIQKESADKWYEESNSMEIRSQLASLSGGILSDEQRELEIKARTEQILQEAKQIIVRKDHLESIRIRVAKSMDGVPHSQSPLQIEANCSSKGGGQLTLVRDLLMLMAAPTNHSRNTDANNLTCPNCGIGLHAENEGGRTAHMYNCWKACRDKNCHCPEHNLSNIAKCRWDGCEAVIEKSFQNHFHDARHFHFRSANKRKSLLKCLWDGCPRRDLKSVPDLRAHLEHDHQLDFNTSPIWTCHCLEEIENIPASIEQHLLNHFEELSSTQSCCILDIAERPSVSGHHNDRYFCPYCFGDEELTWKDRFHTHTEGNLQKHLPTHFNGKASPTNKTKCPMPICKPLPNFPSEMALDEHFEIVHDVVGWLESLNKPKRVRIRTRNGVVNSKGLKFRTFQPR